MSEDYGLAKAEFNSAEKTEKAEIINDRLNALSIDMKSNLEYARQIGNIMLGAEEQSEDESKKAEASPAGWLGKVIDMLIFINNNNYKLKKELVRIRKEFKK